MLRFFSLKYEKGQISSLGSDLNDMGTWTHPLGVLINELAMDVLKEVSKFDQTRSQ